jgi:hypothetical protein
MEAAETLLDWKTIVPVLLAAGIVAGLLGRQKLKDLLDNSKGAVCPIVDSGQTPLTKEQHDETCVLRLEVVKQDVSHIKEAVDRIEKHLNGGK